MKKQINCAVKLLALAAALGVASGASAQSAGQWVVAVGMNKIEPDVKSEPVSAPALPNSKADIGADMQPVVTIARMLTDNISVEVDLGVPYKHKIYGAGALEGTGKMGSSEVLPPTSFLRYHLFQPNSKIRPYVGLGITYAIFRNETGSGQLTAVLDPGGKPVTFSMKNKWAASAKIGTTISFKENWFVDVHMVKTKLKTTATYSTGQTQVAAMDPTAVAISVGHNFNWKW